MIEVEYNETIVVTEDFIKKLLDDKKEEIYMKLRYINKSSKYFKKCHLQILPEVYKNLHDKNPTFVGSCFHKISYSEIIEKETLGQIDKNILSAIRISQIKKEDRRFDCDIFTTKIDEYLKNKHMYGITKVKILDYETSLNIINKFFDKYKNEKHK